MTTPDPFAQLDAAYALGALDADDLAAFEAHLRTCADCRARVDELRPTVRLLAAARATGDVALQPADAGPVPDTLLPRLLHQAQRERARRRRLTSAVAVLAAACLIALLVVVWPSSSTSPARQSFVAVRTTPVEATARLVSKPWGTEIDVRCRYSHYAAALRGDYGLRVVERDRTTHDLGTWALVPSGVTTFTGGTAIHREQIASVQITLADGTPVLQLTP